MEQTSEGLGRHRVAVLSGTGHGPEFSAHLKRALDALAELHGFALELDYPSYGAEALQRSGQRLPEGTVAACRAADAVLALDADSGALRPLLGALRPDGGRQGLRVGPLGAWLEEGEGGEAQLFPGRPPLVALVHRELPEDAGFAAASPRPALAAACLLLEALGERAAATTLGRALHHGEALLGLSPEEQVSALIDELASLRLEFEHSAPAPA